MCMYSFFIQMQVISTSCGNASVLYLSFGAKVPRLDLFVIFGISFIESIKQGKTFSVGDEFILHVFQAQLIAAICSFLSLLLMIP